MTFLIPFSGCGINKVFVSMSGCFGGCTVGTELGSASRRVLGVTASSSRAPGHWESCGIQARKDKLPSGAGKGKGWRGPDYHGSLSTARESRGAQILWRILWGIPVRLLHIPITHSQQVVLHSSPMAPSLLSQGCQPPALPRAQQETRSAQSFI